MRRRWRGILDRKDRVSTTLWRASLSYKKAAETAKADFVPEAGRRKYALTALEMTGDVGCKKHKGRPENERPSLASLAWQKAGRLSMTTIPHT
jgi:hypothetical protein